MANFTIIEIISRVKITEGRGIRDRRRLQREYGRRKWIKCKGQAKVKFGSGDVHDVELHWYEAHGIGRREEKIVKVIR